MKKSVSFCFLSILLIVFGFIPKTSQGQEDCTSCLWLENQDPAVHVFERTTLEKPVMGETDLYRIFFETDCVNPNAKISLEWEIFRDGVLLDGSSNLRELSRYADIKLMTMYNRINNGLLTLPLPEGTCQVVTTDPNRNREELKTYPGAIMVYPGISLAEYSLDFFYLHFFQFTENYLEIKWNQAWIWEGCQIVLKVVERTNGTDYPSFYYSENQNLNIGGHQSKRGRVLATDTLQKLHRGTKYDEVCFEDLAYEFGWPIQEFNYSDTLLIVDVPFYNPECLNRIDSVVKLTLMAFPELNTPEFDPYFLCQYSGDVTLEAEITQESNLGDIFLEWRTGEDGEWVRTAPVHNTDEPGVYPYYIRAAMDGELTSCYSEEVLVNVTVFELPERIVDLDKLVEFCINTETTPLTVVPSENCFIEWFVDGEWKKLEVNPAPATDEAGTEIYLVRQSRNFTDELVCSSSPVDTITVNVFAYPVVDIELSANPVCEGDELTLTAIVENENAEMEYVWNFGVPAKTGAQVTDIADLEFTLYSVSATEIHTEARCSVTIDTTVTVLPQPTITFENKTSCHGTTFEARPIIPEDVVFAWVAGYEIDFDTVLVNTTNAPITYKFAYTARDTSTTPSCIREAELEVTVYPLPTPEITPQTLTVCAYSPFVLNVSDTKEYEDETLDATTFDWLNETITDGAGYLPIAGIVDVIVKATNAYGCVAYDTIQATVQPLPEIVVTSDKENNTMCEFEIATISVSGDYDFEWSANAGEVENVSEITVSPAPGRHTYYVTATDKVGEDEDALLCSIVDSITITVNELPRIAVVATPAEICFNETSTLSIEQENEDDELTVVWGTTDGTNVFGPIEGGLHTVYVTVTNDVTSCERVDSVQILVNPRPSVTYTYAPEVNQRDFKICSGTHVEVLANAPGEYMTYNWLLNTDEGPLLDVRPENADQEPITKYYHIEITDANPAYDHACVLKDSIYLIIFAKPAPMIQAETDVICADDSVELYLSTAYTSYKWSTGEETATIFAKENKTYKVTVTNEAGCEGIDEFHVITLPVPEIVINASATTICSGEAVVLTPVEQNGTHTTYTWDYTDGRVSNAGVLTTNSINNESGEPMKVTFTVTGVLDNGCDTEISIEITVNPRPDAAIVSNKNVICPGDSVKLIAQDNNTYVEIDNVPVYRWSSNTGFTNEDSIYVKPVAGLTEYRLTVTNSYNCSHWVPKFVDVHPIPAVTIEGDREICAGEQVNTLTATVSPDENVSYLWSNGDETAETNAVVAGEYTVTVTTENGCAVASETVTLIVNENPIDSITGGDAICLGSTAILSVTPGGNDKNYTWKLNGEGDVISTDQTLRLEDLEPGTYRYTVIVENVANGCTVTLAKTLTVNNLPAPELAILAEGFCVTQNINLSSTAEGEDLIYTWTVDGVTLEDATAPEVTFIPANAVSYYVTLTIKDTVTGCENTATKTIEVKPLPNYELDSEVTVCSGNSIEVGVDADAYYTYVWAHNGEITPKITVTPSEKTTYYVNVNLNGCIVVDSVVVDVRERPVFTKVEDKNICLGASADLVITDYTEDTRFFWSTGGRGDSIRVTPRVITIYVVSADYADVGNCGVFDTIIVNVELPITIDVEDAVSMCLNAPKTVTIEDPVDGATYTWTGFGEEPTTGTSITLEYEDAGEYTLTVSAVTALGCNATPVEVVVTVHNTPGADLGVQYDTVCAGNEVTLTVPAEFEEYNWVGFNPAETGQSVTFIPAASGTFICEIVDAFECPSTVEFEVTVNPLPDVSYDYDPSQVLCNNDVLVITPSSTIVDPSFYWIANNGTQPYLNTTVVNTGTEVIQIGYAIRVTNTLTTCVLHDTAWVSVKPSPKPIITPETAIFCEGSSLTLDAGDFDKFAWNTGNAGDTLQTLEVTEGGTYKVTVYDDNGCAGIAEREVTMVPLVDPLAAASKGEICPNDEVTISAAYVAGWTYSWNTGHTTSSFTENRFPNNSNAPIVTEFVVTVTNNNGLIPCSVTDTVKVTVNPLPRTVILTDEVTCIGADMAAVAQDNNAPYAEENISTTWLWGDGSTEEEYTFTGEDYGLDTIWLTGTNTYGCELTTFAKVLVDSIVPLKISEITPACYGETITVDILSEYNVAIWRNADGVSVGTGSTVTLTPVAIFGEGEDKYTIEATTGAHNCPAFTEFYISQRLPIAANEMLSRHTATVCANELPYEVVAIEGFDSYAWYNITEGASDVEVSDSRMLVANAAGMYELRVIDEFGCPGVDTFTLNVNSLPVVTTDLQMIKICADATFVDVTGAFEFGDNVYRMFVSYDDHNTLIATFVNPADSAFLHFDAPTPMEDTTVFFQFFTTNDCVMEIEIPLTVIALPNPTTENRHVYYCESSEAGVEIGFEEAGYTYIWEGIENETGNTITVNPSVDTWYKATISLSEAPYCSVVDSIFVDVVEDPTFTINGVVEEVCLNAEVNLSVTGNANTYVWTVNGELVTVENNLYTLPTSVAGTYEISVTGTITNGGCTATVTDTITVREQVVLVNDTLDAQCLTAGGNTFTFVSPVEFTSYVWNGTSMTAGTFEKIYTESGDYTVTLYGIDDLGCASTTMTFSATVNPLPTADIDLDAANYCVYDEITASTDQGDGYSYEWNLSDENTDIIYLNIAELGIENDDTLKLTVTNEFGCTASDYAVLVINETPDLTIGDLGRFCEDATAYFKVERRPNYTYSWNGETPGTDTSYMVTAGDHAREVQEITLTVKDVNTGCERTSTGTVLFDSRPYIDVTEFNSPSDIIFTKDGVTGAELKYDIIVRNECGYGECTPVSIQYKIFRGDDPNPIVTEEGGVNEMSDFITTYNSIRYSVNQRSDDMDQFISINQDRSYYDIQASGNIPTGEGALSNYAEHSRRQLYLGNSSSQSLPFDWFLLHFLTERRITVTYDAFTQPGDYRIEYTLVRIAPNPGATETYNVYEVAYLDHNEYDCTINGEPAGNLVGGHHGRGVADELAFRTITLTIGGEPIAPQPAPIAPIVTPVAEPTIEAEMTVFPVPTRDQVNLRVRNVEPGTATVSINDLRGNVLETFEASIADADVTVITRYLQANYTNGTYVVVLRKGRVQVTETIVIMK